MKYLSTVLLAAFLLSCDSRSEPTIKCIGIWEIELLHEGATAEVVDGVLRLRVINPQTDHDIRLTQKQTDYHPPGQFGLHLLFENLYNEATGSNNFDMQLKAWYAYNYAPDVSLASMSYGKYGARGTANRTEYQLFSQTPPIKGDLNFGSGGTTVTFGAGGIGAVPIPAVLPDPKTLYIDFGVRQNTGTGKSSLIEVDITEVSFIKGAKVRDEYLNDTFDCNSLK